MPSPLPFGSQASDPVVKDTDRCLQHMSWKPRSILAGEDLGSTGDVSSD